MDAVGGARARWNGRDRERRPGVVLRRSRDGRRAGAPATGAPRPTLRLPRDRRGARRGVVRGRLRRVRRLGRPGRRGRAAVATAGYALPRRDAAGARAGAGRSRHGRPARRGDLCAQHAGRRDRRCDDGLRPARDDRRAGELRRGDRGQRGGRHRRAGDVAPPAAAAAGGRVGGGAAAPAASSRHSARCGCPRPRARGAVGPPVRAGAPQLGVLLRGGESGRPARPGDGRHARGGAAAAVAPRIGRGNGASPRRRRHHRRAVALRLADGRARLRRHAERSRRVRWAHRRPRRGHRGPRRPGVRRGPARAVGGLRRSRWRGAPARRPRRGEHPRRRDGRARWRASSSCR